MTDFRALCAELHTAFNTYAVDESHHDLLVRARAALAQPELQAPTDEELSEFATDWWNGFAYAEQGADVATSVIDIIHPWHFADFSRDVLARWSRPTTEPVPVSERPWEREGWCNAHQRCWVWNEGNCRWWEFIDSRMISFSHDDYTHCLPHWALPVPNFDLITQGE